MKSSVLIIFFSLVISPLWAADVSLKLKFPVERFSTGELVNVEIIIDANSAQGLSFQSLKGETIGETIYIQSLSPLILREGEQHFTVDAQVVLIRKPTSNQIQTTFKGNTLFIGWDNVEIEAVDTPSDYVLEDFTVPTPLNILRWVLLFIIFSSVIYGLWVLKKKWSDKKLEKKRLAELKRSLLSGKDYAAVVEIWKKKHAYLKSFPMIETAFTNLESVLFKFQFKPQRTMEEEFKVMEAYRNFIKDAEGELRGV
jgi:hypothetical protein